MNTDQTMFYNILFFVREKKSEVTIDAKAQLSDNLKKTSSNTVQRVWQLMRGGFNNPVKQMATADLKMWNQRSENALKDEQLM